MAQCYALIAACQYAGTPKALTATSQDAAAFSQLLQTDLAVPAANITLMDEAGDRPPTAASIRKALNFYAGKAVAGDSILFYFAGHGVSIQDPAGPKRALVCSDLDLLLRYDVNSIATSAAEGVKFTVVADASNASDLLPHAPVNGADGKEVVTDNTGRKLGPQKYVQMFQQAYPNAGMTLQNILQVVRQRFPLEGAPAAPAAAGQAKPGQPGAPQAGGVPQRSRVRRAGPLGEGIEGRGDDDEDEGDGLSREERRRRNDEDGDERRRRRRDEEGEEGGRRRDDDEEEGEEGGRRRPGQGRRDDEEEGEEGGGRRPGHGRRPDCDDDEGEEGGRRRPGQGRRDDDKEEGEEGGRRRPGQGRRPEGEEEEGEEGGRRRPGQGRRPEGEEEEGEEGGRRRPGQGRRPEGEEEEGEDGGRRRPGQGRRPEGEEGEDEPEEGHPRPGRRPGQEQEPGEGGQPPNPEGEQPGEGGAPTFPGFGRPQHAQQAQPGQQPGAGQPPAADDGAEEGDEAEAPDAAAPPEPTDGGVGERGVLFSASFKKSVVSDGAGFTVALIKAVRQAKAAGPVTNQAVIDALMAVMAETNPRMIPTLACSAGAAGEPFFGC